MKTSSAVSSLAALGQENRLDAYRLLVQAGPRGLPAGQLSAKLDLAAPTLSFHLNHLRHAGLVERRRDGRSIIYAANLPAIERLIAYLQENCVRSGGGRPPAPANANRAGTRPRRH